MRNLYSGTTFMYPIRGAIRFSHAATPPGTPPLYVLYERRETSDGSAESYEPLAAFDHEPTPSEITPLISIYDEQLLAAERSVPTAPREPSVDTELFC